MLSDVHLWLWAVICVLAAVTLAVGIAGTVRNRFDKLTTDRLILAVLAVLALTSIVGPTLLVTGHQPGDALHYVYAVVAWLALPAGRYIAGSGSDRRRAGTVAVAAAILLGALLRLYMTGPGA